MQGLARMFVAAGLGIAIFGCLLYVLDRFAPGLRLGQLPGDVVVKRDGFSLFIPITTMLAVSAVVTLVLWTLGAWRR